MTAIARLVAPAVAAAFAVVIASLPARAGESGLAGGSDGTKQSTGATKKLNPRTAMTGTWNRYPEMGAKPDPKFPAAAPIPAPPLKPEYVADYEARRKAITDAEAKGQPLYTNYTACLPDGMPSMMMSMFPMEVLQTPGQVTIIQEAYNQVRRIYMGYELPPVEDAEPLYWGHSSGKWEGDTLVVETVGIKENVRFRDAPHSAQMRIHERIKMLSPDMMQDEITITDPQMLTGPWSFKYMYKRAFDYKMNEYVCEANREYADPDNGGTRLKIGK